MMEMTAEGENSEVGARINSESSRSSEQRDGSQLEGFQSRRTSCWR